jgi:hypothetical protein
MSSASRAWGGSRQEKPIQPTTCTPAAGGAFIFRHVYSSRPPRVLILFCVKFAIMQSVFSGASRRTNSQGEKKGPGRDGALKTLCIMRLLQRPITATAGQSRWGQSRRGRSRWGRTHLPPRAMMGRSRVCALRGNSESRRCAPCLQ